MTNNNNYIETGFSQINKNKQRVNGDTIQFKKVGSEKRFLFVLSDGLGSGIFANVLSNLTASMALNYRLRNEPVSRTARNIINILPVDGKRKISYSTFTLADVDYDGEVNIIELDNPSFILIRNGKRIFPEKTKIDVKAGELDRTVFAARIQLFSEERIIFFSDGVTQSGIGSPEYPIGWGEKGVCDYIISQIEGNKTISAKELSDNIISASLQKDGYKAKDDISCAVLYMRKPRKSIICSGPPYEKEKDEYLTSLICGYDGKKIICGGTTANIVSRIMNKEIVIDMTGDTNELPPVSSIEGIDLVTEGILTLAKVSEFLENKSITDSLPADAAGNVLSIILNSDIIDFVVGTRINNAHQDPNLPEELEIRRNIIKKIAGLLEEKFLKKVSIKYI
ncbi:MAG: SpoIIE family protein phosphatase [Ignavibacteria bacterium]|nr:SpoIIE family protein phosphatase [Ignavibacteria bacterium]